MRNRLDAFETNLHVLRSMALNPDSRARLRRVHARKQYETDKANLQIRNDLVVKPVSRLSLSFHRVGPME